MKPSVYFFCCAVLAIFLSSPAALFAEPSPNELQSVDQKVAILEAKVNRLNTTQTQIIQKQNEIKEELDALRIWIRQK